jgi:hypothetical protein
MFSQRVDLKLGPIHKKVEYHRSARILEKKHEFSIPLGESSFQAGTRGEMQ